MSERGVILLAEDREDDIVLIRNAFARANIRNPLFIVRDGEEATAYLKGTGKYSRRDEFPLPDLLLLDLKMPGMDGFEVLKWIRQQPGFSQLRVLVLTSSNQIRDVNQAYQLGANSFLVKPYDFDDFTELSRLIQHFWLLQSLPPQTFRPKDNPKSSAGIESQDENQG